MMREETKPTTIGKAAIGNSRGTVSCYRKYHLRAKWAHPCTGPLHRGIPWGYPAPHPATEDCPMPVCVCVV